MLERVARFIEDPEREPFEQLATEACREQASRFPAWAELCARHGSSAAGLEDWRCAPPVASRDLEAAGFPAAGRPPHPELFHAALAAALPPAVLAGIGRPPILSLIAELDEAPASSLALMADHVLRHFGDEPSVAATGSGPQRARAARSWLAARQRGGRPALLLATSSGVDRLLDSLERLDLRFRLPPGSRLLESVGEEEPETALDRGAPAPRLADRLGIGAESTVRELGIPGLTSRFYTRALAGGHPEVFVPPAWTRVRILEPQSLQEVPPGTTGRISIFDLAAFGSALHQLTESLGISDGRGFRRVGRIPS